MKKYFKLFILLLAITSVCGFAKYRFNNSNNINVQALDDDKDVYVAIVGKSTNNIVSTSAYIDVVISCDDCNADCNASIIYQSAKEKLMDIGINENNINLILRYYDFKTIVKQSECCDLLKFCVYVESGNDLESVCNTIENIEGCQILSIIYNYDSLDAELEKMVDSAIEDAKTKLNELIPNNSMEIVKTVLLPQDKIERYKKYDTNDNLSLENSVELTTQVEVIFQ